MRPWEQSHLLDVVHVERRALRLDETLMASSSIARQLALFPMRIFAVGIEYPLDVSVDRSQDTHFCEQHWPAVLGGPLGNGTG
jgi:hypothetical protein